LSVNIGIKTQLTYQNWTVDPYLEGALGHMVDLGDSSTRSCILWAASL